MQKNIKKLVSLTISFFMILTLSYLLISNVVSNAADVSTEESLQNALNSNQDIKLSSNITINQTIIIPSNYTGKIDGGNNTITLGKVLENMFVVSTGNSDFEITNIIINADKKGRIFDISNRKTMTISDATIINGTTQNFEKKDENGVNKQRYQGGAIYINNSTLNLKDVIFENNTTKNTTPRPNNIGDPVLDPHGGAIYSTNKSIISISKGKFSNNSTGGVDFIDGNQLGTNGEGGAIKLEGGSKLYINDENTSDRITTLFEGNHCDNWVSHGGRQGGAIEATNSEVHIYAATFKISGPFDTGGAIKFEGANGIIKNADFMVISKNQGGNADSNRVGIAGGSITSEDSNLSIDNSSFKVEQGAGVREAGGLIQVVGSGTFNLTNSILEGGGASWNQSWMYNTAKYGGAISFYTGSTVTAKIEKTEIKNFMADMTGGAISVSNKIDDKSNVNLTIKDTNITNTHAYTFANDQTGGGIFIGPGNKVVIDGGNINKAVSNNGGAIFNQGKLIIQGGTNIKNNLGYQMAGGIYNGGYLRLDSSNFSENRVEGDRHVLDQNQHGGANIYADKSIIVTPNASFDDKDIRIIDKQSNIFLTGHLNNKINVSITEKPITTTSDKKLHKIYIENPQRHIGYIVAKGINSSEYTDENDYTPTEDDAKFLHYITKDNSQAVSEYNDHISPGKWDYVLDPVKKEVVLGQRAKMIYHSNGSDDIKAGFDGNSDNGNKEQLYTIYSSVAPWSSPKQMKVLNDKPERNEYAFAGWYYNEKSTNEKTAVTSKPDVQELGKDKLLLNDKFNFDEVKFTSSESEITNILEPYIINTYAGWIKDGNISINVTKKWEDENNKDNIRPENIIVKLFANDKDTKKILTLSESNRWTDKFDKLDVVDEDGKNINYKIEEISVDGYISTVLGDVESGFVITNKRQPKPNPPIIQMIPATTNVKVKKVWIGSDSQESVKVRLLKNGFATDNVITLNKNNNWSNSFTNLKVVDDVLDSVENVYSVEEVGSVDGKIKYGNDEYVVEINGDSKSGFIITNKKEEKIPTPLPMPEEPEKMSLSVSKKWEGIDADKAQEVKVYLVKNNVKTEHSIVLNAYNEWKGKFENLLKRDVNADKDNVYTVKEDREENGKIKIGNDNYKVTYINTDINVTITNKKEEKAPIPLPIPEEPEKISLSVSKKWEGIEADKAPEVRIYLIKNGVKMDKSLVLNKKNNWSGNFNDLPKLDSINKKANIYTVAESGSVNGKIMLDGNNYLVSIEESGNLIKVKNKLLDKSIFSQKINNGSSSNNTNTTDNIDTNSDNTISNTDIANITNNRNSIAKYLPKTGSSDDIFVYIGLLLSLAGILCYSNSKVKLK